MAGGRFAALGRWLMAVQSNVAFQNAVALQEHRAQTAIGVATFRVTNGQSQMLLSQHAQTHFAVRAPIRWVLIR